MTNVEYLSKMAGEPGVPEPPALRKSVGEIFLDIRHSVISHFPHVSSLRGNDMKGRNPVLVVIKIRRTHYLCSQGLHLVRDKYCRYELQR